MNVELHFCGTCNARDRVHQNGRCVICGSFYQFTFRADPESGDEAWDALQDEALREAGL